jgi:aerobic C4-dicarboxylate transport protein
MMKGSIMAPIPIAAAADERGPWYKHLYIQVVAAIVAGVLLGHFYPQAGEAMKPIGDAFIKLVKMIIAPVIFLTIVTGIAGMRDLASVGRVAGKAFAYFLLFSTLALFVGLIMANLVRPGAGLNIDPATLDASKVASFAEKAHEATVTGFLMSIIPDTFVGALTEGSILQTLFVAILFGIGLALIGERGTRLTHALEEVSLAVFKVVAILMRAAPFGAFGAMAFTIGKYGAGTLVNLATLVGTFM